MRNISDWTLWYATDGIDKSQGDLPVQAGDVKKINRSRMRRLSMEVSNPPSSLVDIFVNDLCRVDVFTLVDSIEFLGIEL
jgi:hypothetical protein